MDSLRLTEIFSELTNMVIENHFTVMQKPETLAQLIYRTVLEFEQRQTNEQQQDHLESALTSSNSKATSQLPKKKSPAKVVNRKKKTA